jgi:hypothetical protein
VEGQDMMEAEEGQCLLQHWYYILLVFVYIHT